MQRRSFLQLAPGAAAFAASSSPTTALSLNEDNSHYFFTRAGQKLDAESVAGFVDQYAGTQVRELLFSPNAMRTSYPSEVWDPIWRGYDPNGPDDQPLFASTPAASRQVGRRWVHTAWQLAQMKIDPYQLWIARARRHRISPWLSMRMNDIHNVDDERSYMHGQFWRDHPEMRRVPWRAASWQDRALDYGHAAVRAYHLKLVRELAARYDFDGLELDWMRFPYHFAPGREREGGALLVDFMRQARSIVDAAGARRGRRLKLGVRVPSRPQTAAAMGLDGVRWAQLGLVDMVVVTPFVASIETDMPIELWRRLLPPAVVLAAGFELNIRPYHTYQPQQRNSLETVRGAAAAMLSRGADRVYLFNYMDSQTAMESIDEYRVVLRECGTLATLQGKPRRHIVTYSDTWAPGEALGSVLPKSAKAGEWLTFRVPTGPGWSAAEVRLAFEGPTPGELRVNGGEPCTYAGQLANSGRRPWPVQETHGWKVSAPGGVRGEAVIDVRAGSGELKVHWVEVAV